MICCQSITRRFNRLCVVSKEVYAAVSEDDALWSAAERPYRTLLDRFYCYDMVFECLAQDAARISARQRCVTLARLFALDAPAAAFTRMQCIDRGAESFVYLGAHTSVSATCGVLRRDLTARCRQNDKQSAIKAVDNVALIKVCLFSLLSLSCACARARIAGDQVCHGDAAEPAHAAARDRTARTLLA
jgi:hypothetical protein